MLALRAVVRLIACAVGVALVFAADPGVAFADARTDARGHFSRGMELIRNGEIGPGIAELRRAYEILPHPDVLYNIGVAYHRIESYDQALEAFRGYVESDPPDRAPVEAVISDLEVLVEARSTAPQAPVAPPSAGGEEPPIDVSTEDIEALEEAALQLETLAEVTQSEEASPELRQRAERLRVLSSELAAIERSAGEEPGPGPGPGPGEGPEGEGEVSAQAAAIAEQLGEERENLYEEQVISASRATEEPLDAPSSLAIITDQDIRLSGHTNLAETLRRAAGVTVFTHAPRASQVTVRGWTAALNPRVLTLIDGRSVYWDFLGATAWQALPLVPEDVARIEVIRGPASALYGADAFGGVINILTRDPGEGESSVSFRAGSGRHIRAQGSFDGRVGRFAYRFSGLYEQEDAFAAAFNPERTDRLPTFDPELAYQTGVVGANFRYHMGRGYYTRFGTNGAFGQNTFMGEGDIRQLQITDMVFIQSYANLSTPWGLNVRTFHNHLSGDSDDPSNNPGDIQTPSVLESQEVVDVEVELVREFELLFPHQLIIGAGYRYKHLEWNWVIDGEQNENHFNAFIQDTLRIHPRFTMVGSVRMDKHPVIDELLVAPRGSVIARITPESALRFSASTAFRTPTLLEQYINIDLALPFRGLYIQTNPALTLNAERIISLELGFTTEEIPYVTLEANAFLNYARNFIEVTLPPPAPLSAWVAGDPSARYSEELRAYPVVGLSDRNVDQDFRQIGGELGIRTYPVEGLDIYANYSFHDEDSIGRVTTPTENSTGTTAKHRFNIGIQYRSEFGLDLAVDFHWQADTTWVLNNRDAVFVTHHLPAYTLLNARVGYRLFEDRLELAVIGSNLLFDKHREHPWGQPVDTRIAGEVRLHF